MAYDEGVAQRVREALVEHPGVAEKNMFGGIAFLLHGNMCCGVVGEDLMVRVGPEAYAEALGEPHAREMNFTGRPMRGIVYVSPAGFESDEELARWLARGTGFAGALPAK